MKRAKKLIALLTAATVMLATVLTVSAAEDYGSLKVSYKSFGIVGGYLDSEYPQVDGVSSINSSIENAVDSFYAKYHAELLDTLNGIEVKTNIVDDNGVYSKLEVTLSLYTDFYGDSDETYSYYIDKSDYSEITEEDYEAGLVAEDEEEVVAEEEVAEEEVAEPTEEEVAEIKATMVPLRASLESLGFTLEWNQELAAVEIYADEDLIAILFIGEDLYVVGDTVYELGIVPELEDGVTYVPVAFFTDIVGADCSIDDDGNFIFSIPEVAEVAEEVVEETIEEEAAE